MGQCVPKRWRLNYRRRGITQKKAYNNQFLSNAKVCDEIDFRLRITSKEDAPVRERKGRYTAMGLYVKLEVALHACRSWPSNLNADEETAMRARLRATGPTL
jgi:hypothetical protein